MTGSSTVENTSALPATFVVAGVCCSTEEGVLRKHLDGGIGTDGYRYNPVTCELHLSRPMEHSRVLALVREAGFAAREKQAPEPEKSFVSRHADALVMMCAVLLMCAGFLLEHQLDGLWGRAAFGAAIVIGGARVFRRAFVALRSRVLDMNVLMAAAVIGAVAIGRWEEGAAVVVLFAIALMLENYSAERTRRAIRSLMSLAPQNATVIHGNEERVVEAVDVRPGDVVLVRPGERIPVDGVVVDGESSVNESAITGEAIPVRKERGSPVTGGTLNERGLLRVRVTRRFEETTVAHIVQLIEEAQNERAPIQTFIDRFARIYTPVVFLLALLVAALPPLLFGQPFESWLYRALVLLVIACPCALVISTPITLVSALTNAARRGILIKGGKHLESLSRVRAMAFDKTGTLTRGRPQLTDCVPTSTMSAADLLRISAALEQHSGHHLGVPLLEAARREGIDVNTLRPDKFEAIPGRGIRGDIDGTAYLLGSEEFARASGAWNESVALLTETFRAEGKSTMLLARQGEPLGVIAVRDTARAHLARTLKELKQAGIREITLLSGDHEAAVDVIADELGIDGAVSGMLPGEKAAAVRKMNERLGGVAMVGDGVNDAPALAASTVGISMGVAGADAALETADIVLIADDLGALPHLVELSRKTMAIIRQNIAIALSIKFLFLGLSLAGLSTLWMALLADDGAALAVILNGLRVLAFNGSSR